MALKKRFMAITAVECTPLGSRTEAHVGRLRRLVVVAFASGVGLSAAGLGATVIQTPVAAAQDCANNNTCNWTQADSQTDWPNTTSDPHCYNYCVRWNLDCSYSEEYLNNWTDGSVWESTADWAQHTWDGVPECTPTFNKAANSSSAWLTQVGAQSLPGNPPPCGQWQPQGYQSGSSFILTGGTVVVNSSQRFTSSVSPGVCNIRNTFLHETGHMYGEGHSSVQSDVMYKDTDQGNTAIDGDAHAELAAIYGEPSASGCNSCQFNTDLWLNPVFVHQMSADSYAQMAQAKAGATIQAAKDAEAMASTQIPQPPHCIGGCPGPLG